jgi:uncharacterized protein (UPF0332 family)
VDTQPRTRWEHEGIVKHFALGQWQRTSLPIPRELRKELSTLYQYRLKADYYGLRVTAKEARAVLTTAGTIVTMVAETFAFSVRALRR